MVAVVNEWGAVVVVKRIVGFDDNGKKVFEREAREYDQSIVYKPFAITLSDIIKVVPIFFACVYVYVNQNNFNNTILQSINSVSISTQNNTLAINNLKDVLATISTGKNFKDGMPSNYR